MAKNRRIEEEEDEFAEAGTLVLDKAVEMQAELPEDSGGERADFLKLDQGQNFLRFLPPQIGQEVPWVHTWQHGWGAGANYRTVNCPKMMGRPAKRCPICEERERLLGSSREADRKSAGALKAKLRVITEVVNLTTEEERDKGVRLYAYGRQINDALSGILMAGKMGGDFTHKRNGFPILIVRDGEGVDTSYPTVSATPDRGPVEGEWLLDRIDLTRYSKLPTREEMEAACKALGVRASSDDDDSDNRSTPTAGRNAPAGRGRPNVGDRATERYDIDDDEEEEAPAARPATRRPQAPRR